MATHVCPANGCEIEVAMDKLACPKHWARVSRPTQQRVYQTWRARKRLKTLETIRAHHRAMTAAELEMNSDPGEESS
jgi:hypothetical protein